MSIFAIKSFHSCVSISNLLVQTDMPSLIMNSLQKESIQFNVCPPTLLPARYANIQIKIVLNQSAQKVNIFIAGINVDE